MVHSDAPDKVLQEMKKLCALYGAESDARSDKAAGGRDGVPVQCQV